MRYEIEERVMIDASHKTGTILNILRDEYSSRHDLLRIKIDGDLPVKEDHHACEVTRIKVAHE